MTEVVLENDKGFKEATTGGGSALWQTSAGCYSKQGRHHHTSVERIEISNLFRWGGECPRGTWRETQLGAEGLPLSKYVMKRIDLKVFSVLRSIFSPL